MNNQGWECPRCNRINAPNNPQCFCSTQTRTTYEVTCSHNWVFAHSHPASQPEKICEKCGVNAKFVPITGGWL